MRILVLGGTGFIGPPLVRQLRRAGHTVAVFHRGSTSAALPVAVQHITGDRRNLAAHRPELRRFAPEVVIDLILSSGAQAQALMDVVGGTGARVVAASSMDVYRALAVVHGADPGPLEPVPLTEDSAVRARLHPYPPPVLKELQEVFQWLDDDYDKIPVERAVLGDSVVAGTVLRLPIVYGPGDKKHRLFPVLKRIDDGRTRMLFAEDVAAWRASRGYVENVAAAIALAATSDRAAGRVYNVAEQQPYSELEWVRLIAAQAGWRGEFVLLAPERVPQHLRAPGNANLAQDWVVSSERIRQELGYREPVSQKEALQQTIAWERAHPPAHVDPREFDYGAEDAVVLRESGRTGSREL